MLKKKGGLGSLIPGGEFIINDTDIKMVKTDNIAANPYQPRLNFDTTEIAELAESITSFGILQPLTVRRVGSKYELIAGERRLQAAIKAELSEVPVIVRDCSDQDM